MDRTEIIKALEHCIKDDTCEQCNYSSSTCFIQENALSLIKELTEENERLRGIGLPDDETYIKLSDAKHAIMNYVGEQTVSKYASSEVCKAVRDGAEGAMNELDYLTPVSVAPIADTVRKMQERLKAHLEKPEFPWDSFTVAEEVIDQIAKEMVEGK